MNPRLLLIITAILFSTGGAAIKFNSLTAWQVASFRSLTAAIVLWLALPSVRRAWTVRILILGCAYAATLILFVLATKLTTAANAIFLQATAPLHLLFIGPLLLKEPLRRSDWLVMAAMAAGMSLFFIGNETAVDTAPNPPLGNLLAALSGLTWAITIAGLRWHERREPNAGITTAFAGNLITFAVALGPALPVTAISLQNGLVVTYLGAFQVALAYVLMSRAVRHVPAFESAAILLVEPALNPIWAWLVLGERPSLLAIAGGSIILLTSAIHTMGLWLKLPAQSAKRGVPGATAPE